MSALHAPETTSWYQEAFITLRFPKDAYPFDYHKGSLRLLCKYDKKISDSIRLFTKVPRSKKFSELLARRLNIDTQQGGHLVDLIDVMKSQKKDGALPMTMVGIVDDLHKKMAIFDSFIFLNEAQDRWRESVGNGASVAKPGGYGVTLFSAILIDNKVITHVVAPPKILIEQSDSLTTAENASGQHQRTIKQALQMWPLPTLETMPDGLQKEMVIGIPDNEHILLDIIKSSMAKLFFMKLTLKGLSCKLDEVRDTVNSANKDSLMPEDKKHSSSRTNLNRILRLCSMRP